jgi:hypothetical protein
VKVLAAAVVPAHVKASGAVNAALRLRAELKIRCDISFVQLAERDASYTVRDLPVRTVACTFPLNAVLKKPPHRVSSPHQGVLEDRPRPGEAIRFSPQRLLRTRTLNM